jgi:uncharacterized protein YcfJ
MNSRSNLASRAVLVALGAFVASGAALANPPHWAKAKGRYDRDNREPVYARVVDVDPIVHRVRVTTPERECWNETQQVAPPRPSGSPGSMLIGGLIGGVIGHQFAHDHNRAPTVAGALVGAAIGNEVGRQQAAARMGPVEPELRSVERCGVSYREDYEERIDGYRVTYVFDGREYTTRMPYDPGKRILIDVDVQPVVDGRYVDGRY